MANIPVHSFHIPVLGLAFSIDTPLRVARYGISSVMSIVDDILIEHMRDQYARLHNEPYEPIPQREHDSRARRITAYLNLVQKLVDRQLESLRAAAFEKGSEIVRYFELLPDQSPLKRLYTRMMHTQDASEKRQLEDRLRAEIVAGDIDVNIMTKVDKVNVDHARHPLPAEFSDAVAALRGFASSDLRSSVVLSAGLNQRLFSYIAQRSEFLPDADGKLNKRVTLKVSDYRSAYIQGKILAKKGVWVSEFRVESGLNCGGHAFATDGFLLGPILEEFRLQREALRTELNTLYAAALRERGIPVPQSPMSFRVTAQGGIGTSEEDAFLRNHYALDGTGWGSPFLLVPEATNVDDDTRRRLARARREDYYLSDASPLGIRFNNIRDTASEQTILKRFEEGRPGSPCKKKFLVSNTEFTTEPICTASRQYQKLKIDQLRASDLAPEIVEQRITSVIQKACLCEDLAAAAYLGNNTNGASQHSVAICPGPNLAFFSRIASLEEMVGYIYGRVQDFVDADRPHMFINELRLYVDYLREEVQKRLDSLTAKDSKHFTGFRENLNAGIAYYRDLIPMIASLTEQCRASMEDHLSALEAELADLLIPNPAESAVTV
ncbi:MAG: hypothetical protein MUF82_08520 [Bacteroidetes bacterium]|nr:hypothetical protein [Bacteroidota bacterium]